MEDWKPITEFDGIYDISDCGRVRRAKRAGGTRVGRITKSGPDKDGYLTVMISIACKKYNRKVHRLLATEFIPNPENKPEVNHKDGIKANNVLDNLEWCLHIENQQHAGENNLMAKGSHSGAAKLSEDDVLNIRNSGLPGPELAIRYGVSPATISLVLRRKIWRHV